jgi:hypothetical protein
VISCDHNQAKVLGCPWRQKEALSSRRDPKVYASLLRLAFQAPFDRSMDEKGWMTAMNEVEPNGLD